MLVQIPIAQIPIEALERLIEEFVTREGTDYGEIEYDLAAKVAQVRAQLERKEAVVVFDENAESFGILSCQEWADREKACDKTQS